MDEGNLQWRWVNGEEENVGRVSGGLYSQRRLESKVGYS